MKTNFQMVSELNELIGNAKGAATIDQIRAQLDLIASEFKELSEAISHYDAGLEAINDGDFTPQEFFGIEGFKAPIREIRDGIADVLVTTYGLAHRMGVDADKDMGSVQASNMSKFFTGTESEAAEMCWALADSLGIAVEVRQAADMRQTTEDGEAVCVWAFVSADDSDPERPRGKLLKAPGYKAPVFD